VSHGVSLKVKSVKWSFLSRAQSSSGVMFGRDESTLMTCRNCQRAAKESP
jgi:hypothetical protein